MTICLDSRYSTTRRLVRDPPPSPYLGLAAGQDFLDASGARPAEGGLRCKGFYKAPGQSSRPLISVITAVRNGAVHLERAIRSVLDLDYEAIEYIVVDGASTDGTVDILRRYDGAIDYWVSEPDTGVFAAWNKGLRLSRGDWIAFLGGDDRYEPDAITAYVTFLNDARRDCEFVSSRVRLCFGNGIVVRMLGEPWEWEGFRRRMTTGHVGTLHRRNLFGEVGLYDESFQYCGDYELLLRRGDRLRTGFVDKVTATMLAGGKSAFHLKATVEQYRAKRLHDRGRGVAQRFELLVGLVRQVVRLAVYAVWQRF